MQLSDTTEIRSQGDLRKSLERSIVRGQKKRDRKPKPEHCELGSYCVSSTSNWITQGVLWLSTALVIVALTISYWLPLFD